MAKYEPLIAEMRQELAEITALWSGVGMRQVRVMHHPPGGQPVDITQQHADAIRKASDSLHKAIVVLEGLES